MSNRREFLRQAAIISGSLGVAHSVNAQRSKVSTPAPPAGQGYAAAGTSDFKAGGYRFIPAVFQYSSGVAALPGFQIQRITFRKPVPLSDGFRKVQQIITEAGRPLTALCACELRSPAPLTEQGFRAFNEVYVVTLGQWGIYNGTINPVARSNVCPEINPPAEPSFHAFSFTIKSTGGEPSFVNAGSGERTDGKIVRQDDTSPEGMREKARAVLAEMERRMRAFNVDWSDATATQVYTVYDLYPFLSDEIVRRGAAGPGLTWHFCRPPQIGLDYEMDCRSVRIERTL